MSVLNHKRRSVLYVEERAARCLVTKSGVLRPVIAIATVDTSFPTRNSSIVSRLGVPARATPEMQVVSFVAIVSIGQEVRILGTKRYVTGVCKWTLTVPGIRCRKKPTLQLSTVAFIVSIVKRVTVNPFTVTVCT